MNSLWGDVRHALRSIAGMPVLAGIVIVSLAAGIGVNTVVFSWVQARIFKPIPGVANGGSFLLVEPKAESGSYPQGSWPEYVDLAERLPSLQGLFAFRAVPLNVGEGDLVERAHALLVSPNYYSSLGLIPAAGRFPTLDEASRSAAAPLAVASFDYARSRFGSAAAAVGQAIHANGLTLTIAGVVPERFQGTILSLQFDFWLSSALAPTLFASTELDDRNQRGYFMGARLAAGATRARAQAELDTAMADLARAFPQSNAKVGGEIRQFWEQTRGPQGYLTVAVVVLQGLMLLLLLAVCGNTANLLLARASARYREVGVRLALGASRWRIIRLMMVESLIMALAGAALGVLFALWGTDAIRAVPIVLDLPIRFQTDVDANVLIFALALASGCALIFGALPAVQLSSLSPFLAMHSGSGTPSRTRLRNALMGIEVALALVVLITAALFVGSFLETREVNPGFQKEGVLLSEYDLSGRNVDGAFARDFADRLVARLRREPGIEAAAIAAQVPLDIHGLPLRSFTLEGRTRTEQGSDRALSLIASPGYLETMGIRLVAGSDFVSIADRVKPPEVIVNEEFVRQFLDGQSPLGRQLQSGSRAYTIVGVSADSTYESFGERPAPFIYFSFRDRPLFAPQVHVRTRVGGESLVAPAVRQALRDLDPTIPLYGVRTLSEHVETNQFFRRVPARIFVVLGPLLLALAAIGIYAVVAYSVARRTMEIGVRLALGGTAGRIVLEIVRDTLRPVGAGVVAGWSAVFIVFIHVQPGRPLDKAAFFAVPLILIMVAAAASWVPAWRAARIDPMSALRDE
jgi:putative ABC transport system permease protein